MAAFFLCSIHWTLLETFNLSHCLFPTLSFRLLKFLFHMPPYDTEYRPIGSVGVRSYSAWLPLPISALCYAVSHWPRSLQALYRSRLGVWSLLWCAHCVISHGPLPINSHQHQLVSLCTRRPRPDRWPLSADTLSASFARALAVWMVCLANLCFDRQRVLTHSRNQSICFFSLTGSLQAALPLRNTNRPIVWAPLGQRITAFSKCA